MNLKNLVLATALAVGAPFAIAEETVLDSPLAGKTLWFTDRFVTVFYTVDEENYRAIITFAAAPEGSEQPIQQIVQLNDGQSYQVSAGGYGESKLTTTLILTRINDRLVADVTTDVPGDSSI